MSETERLEILRSAKELSNLDGKNLRSLLPFFDEVLVPAGVAVAEAGRLSHEFFVVADGELEVCRNGRATFLVPGGSFGWRAMQDRGRCDATVVATSTARLLVMGHAQFRAAVALARVA